MAQQESDEDEEHAFDLTGVLKNPLLDLSFDYLLVVEWLPDEDKRTGSALCDRLQGRVPAGKVEYAPCCTRAEVEARLAQARSDVAVRGIPIVHIEAHGEDAREGPAPRGFVGPDGNGGSELLEWERLGEVLRPLNIATRFNLLVVGAACHGEGVLLGARGGAPMPFVAVVGYTDTIPPMSLRDSLLELYRGLLLHSRELGAAVEEANRERHFPDDAVLRSTSMAVQLAESFIEGTAMRIRRLHEQTGADVGLIAGLQVLNAKPGLSVEARHRLRTRLEDAWAAMWMQHEMPENARRFAIDADRLVAMALEYAGRL